MTVVRPIGTTNDDEIRTTNTDDDDTKHNSLISLILMRRGHSGQQLFFPNTIINANLTDTNKFPNICVLNKTNSYNVNGL